MYQEYDLQNALHENRFIGLWRMLTGFRGAFIGANLSTAMSALFKTLTFLLLQYFIDSVLGDSNPANTVLIWIALGFVVLALGEGAGTFLSGRLAAHTAEGAVQRLRDYTFDHIQRLTFTYHDQAKSGELIQRATSDVDALRRFFAEQSVGAGRITLLFLINWIAVMRINMRLALLSVVVTPFVLVVSLWFFKRIETAYEEYQEQDGKLSATLQENLSGVRVVKAFARQSFEEDKFEKENAEKYRLGRRLIFMHSLFWPISDIVIGIQMLIGFVVGAQMAMSGVISIGQYLAYAGMLIWILWPLRNLGRLIVQMSQAMVSWNRLQTLLREKREPLLEGAVDEDVIINGDVVFDNVGFSYAGTDKAVLKNLTFNVRSGQTVGILGPTGSGKTTLVNLLLRFYDYDSGSIKIDGRELKDYPRALIRDQIGIVQQEAFLFSRNIEENIAYGVSRVVESGEVHAAADAASVHDVILTFPKQYGTVVGERGVTLSGGQKQRVTLARTLLQRPKLLILDSATSAVDTETEARIRAALTEYSEDATTFIITHRAQSIMDSDLILVMQDGTLAQHGTHATLIEEDGIYRRTYELQSLAEHEFETEIGLVSG